MYSMEDFYNCLDAISGIHQKTGVHVNQHLNMPASGSPADIDSKTFADREMVLVVWSQLGFLLEASGEHLDSLARVCKEPTSAITPWTSVRCLLEACAVGLWLLDPNVDVRSRVQRSFAYRYEGLVQQQKFLHALNSSQTQHVAKHIDAVEAHALSLGFELVIDKRGKRIGIGQKMPSTTTLVQITMSKEYLYRFFSGFTHLHSWALVNFSFKKTQNKPADIDLNISRGLQFQQKHIEISSIVLLTYLAIGVFFRFVKALGSYYGWNLEEYSKDVSDILKQLPTLPKDNVIWGS